MKLTKSEKLAITKGEAIRTMEGGVTIVIVRADVYEKSRKVFYTDEPLTEEEQLLALQQTGERAGWNDPEMNVYDELDPKKRQ